MKGLVTTFLLLAVIINPIFAQIEPEHRETFLEGESYFLFEEYAEAITYYEQLKAFYPENDDINYKIGVCLLNDPYRKEESIAYLEEAVQNINPDYKENSFRETQAPTESLFYLGTAYRKTNQIEKAIETYERFKEVADPEVYDLELVDDQIASCNNALEMMKKPVDYRITNLGERINTRHSDVNPVVSGDRTRLVYIQQQAFYDAVFFSEKIDGEWSYPRNIMFELAVDEDVYPTALSFDGTRMLIYRSDNFIGDLYISDYVDNQWTPPQRLNENINTKYWESHGCFSADGQTIWFTSNRKGSIEESLDIYYSEFDSLEQEWGEAVHLGPVVNTKYNEETPFVTFDGQTLYFSSYGHYNMGGYDVFYSNLLEDGSWSAPINLGYPLNTPDDDLFYHPLEEGYHAYYPRVRKEDNFGKRDIYLIELFTEEHPRKFTIKGIAGISDLKLLTKPLRVSLIAKYSRDTIARTRADMETGAFQFDDATRGEYDILIESDETKPVLSSLIIPDGYTEEEYAMATVVDVSQTDSILKLFEPKILDKIQTDDTLIYVLSGDTLGIPLVLERNALLVSSYTHDSTGTVTDTVQIDSARFTYELKPQLGKNLLRFEMIDSAGVLSYKDVMVIFSLSRVRLDPETDSLVPVVVKKPKPVVVEPCVNDLISVLMQHADPDEKQQLKDLDPSRKRLATPDQLIDFLNDHFDAYADAGQEIRTLILVSLLKQYPGAYLVQLNNLAGEQHLRRLTEGINLYESGITTLGELHAYLIRQAGKTGQTGQSRQTGQSTQATGRSGQAGAAGTRKAESTGSAADEEAVNNLFALLAQHASIGELISEVYVIDRERGLGAYAEKVNNKEDRITSSVDLFVELLRKAGRYDYTHNELFEMLFALLAEKDQEKAHDALKDLASADLHHLVRSLESQEPGIIGMYRLLLEEAPGEGISRAEIYCTYLQLIAHLEKNPLPGQLSITELPPEKSYRKHWFWGIEAGLFIILLIILVRLNKKDR